jgi:hypothetical protein
MNPSLLKSLSLFAVISLPILVHAQSVGYESSVTDLGVQHQSGFYQAAGTITGDVPDTAHSWTHLFNARHSNTANNHQFQIATTYAENDRMFFRKIATGANASRNTTWHEVATRGVNSFSGTQTMTGINVPSSFYTGGGYLFIRPQNSTLEGGELILDGATSAMADWHIDSYNGQLRFFNGTAYNVFNANGNVGIGTSSPDHKLDVNGAVRAKEFFVETGWADFVFQDDYELPSLGEVKTHIEEHGHLPGVPSSAEVQKNGLEMGQAQTLMMQKIEELTLYVLQLSDENAALKENSTELQSRLRDLEDKMLSE